MEQSTNHEEALTEKILSAIFEHFHSMESMGALNDAPDEVIRTLAAVVAAFIAAAPGIVGLKNSEEALAFFAHELIIKLAAAADRTPDSYDAFVSTVDETMSKMFNALEDAVVDAAVGEKRKSTVQ